ncbi:MAG: phosphohistidine phosphatase SixA [Labilithrix sp.]|nr:phosphohistidine phosphatase SixA [Labilithrix sp.]
MKLYVMRHGPAEDDSPTGRDADRALTASGRDRVRSVAKALEKEGEAPAVVISSPLVRALQTAEIVAAQTGIAEPVEIRREIAPGGDVLSLLVELVGAGRKRVMIVGHEPDLSMLVARLIGRTPPEGMLKAMVVGVKLTPEGAGIEGLGFAASERFVLDPKSLAWQRS